MRVIGLLGFAMACVCAAFDAAAADLLVTGVYPASAARQSYFRVINPGTAAGTYRITLTDSRGQAAGTLAGAIPAGTARQIAAAAGVAAAAPLSARVSLSFAGAVQHMLADPASGAVSNVTACPAGGEAASTALYLVNTSRTASPATLTIVNRGSAAMTAGLTLRDAATAAALGTWAGPMVPAGGSATVAMAAIETGAGWRAADDQVTVVLDPAFTGTISASIDVAAARVTADMTLRCPVAPAGALVAAATLAENLRVDGLVAATAGRRSYLRIDNPSPLSGWYEISFVSDRGQALGAATGSIAAGAARQIDAAQAAVQAGIALGAGQAKVLSAVVRLGFDGLVQHVQWDGGAIVNFPAGSAEAVATTLFQVQTSRLTAYPSTLIIANTGAAPAAAKLTLRDTSSGAALAVWTSQAIAAGGSVAIAMSTVEREAGWTPGEGTAQVTVALDPAFNGVLRHVVENAAVAVATDLTTAARLRRSGAGTALSGRVTGWDANRPGLVSVSTIGNSARLATAAVAADGAFTVAGLDAREQYEVHVEQAGARIERATAAPLVTGDTVALTRTAVEGLEASRFVYHWQGDAQVSGSEYSSYVNKPLDVQTGGAATATPESDAALALHTRYGVQLVNDDQPWTREQAARLLETFDRLPQAETDATRALSDQLTGKISRWSLSAQEIPDDIVRLDAAYKGGRVRIGASAFTYAAPLLATVDGRRGSFFSNRLFRAVVRYATNDATDLAAVQALMKARYGVKVAIDGNFEGLYATLPVNAADRTPAQWQPFKPSEFLALIAMFEEFPEGMRDLSFPNASSGLRYLLRRIDGYKPANGAGAVAWTASGYIEFMPDAFASDLVSLHSLIAHEKGHFVWRLLMSATLRDQWLRLSGWSKVDPRLSAPASCTVWRADHAAWTSNVSTADLLGADKDPYDPGETLTSSVGGDWASCTTTEFVSAYAAQTNPNEDFAETVAYFLVNPDRVRARSPSKYEFMRDRVMQGTVYLSMIRPDLTFEVLNLYPDYVYPGKVNRVDILVEGAANADKRVTITLGVNTADCGNANAGNCLSSVSLAYMRLFSTRGTFLDLYLTPVSGNTVTGSFLIPKDAASGWWAPRSITLTDPVGNQRVEKTASDDFGWKLYIDNPAQDLVAPQYIPRSLTASILRAGQAGASSDLLGDEQEVVVGWRVREDVSMDGGFCFTRFAYEPTYGTNTPGYLDQYGSAGFNGYTAFAGVQADGATGQCEVRIRATRFFPSGSWYPGTLDMKDRALNYTQVTFGVNANTSEAPTRVSLQTTASDTTAPVAEIGVCRTSDPQERCLRLSATPTNPASPNGETEVVLSYWAYENQGLSNASGLDQTSITLRDPQGATFQFYHIEGYNTVVNRSPQRTRYFTCPAAGAPAGTCDATTPVQYVFRTILPAGSAPGVWGVVQMQLWDKARNTRSYDFTETLRFSVAR